MVGTPTLCKMDFSSAGALRLHWILTIIIAAVGTSAVTRTVLEGESLTLSCRYSVKRHGPRSVCWGRGCGALWCSGIIVQTDGSRVVSKMSEKYRLAGDLQSGFMDLTMTNVSQTDKGPVCCRVDIAGYFNDKKVFYTVKVVKAVTAAAKPMRSPTEQEQHPTGQLQPAQPQPLLSTETWLDIQPSLAANADVVNHSSILPSVVTTDKETSYLLQVQTPILSLCICLLFLLVLGSMALLAFKRKIHKAAFFTGCTEPHYITREIQARRPVEENIYILD